MDRASTLGTKPTALSRVDQHFSWQFLQHFHWTFFAGFFFFFSIHVWAQIEAGTGGEMPTGYEARLK